jgi:hypothetical protein
MKSLPLDDVMRYPYVQSPGGRFVEHGLKRFVSQHVGNSPNQAEQQVRNPLECSCPSSANRINHF